MLKSLVCVCVCVCVRVCVHACVHGYSKALKNTSGREHVFMQGSHPSSLPSTHAHPPMRPGHHHQTKDPTSQWHPSSPPHQDQAQRLDPDTCCGLPGPALASAGVSGCPWTSRTVATVPRAHTHPISTNCGFPSPPGLPGQNPCSTSDLNSLQPLPPLGPAHLHPGDLQPLLPCPL
jgi:hypothetical protein